MLPSLRTQFLDRPLPARTARSVNGIAAIYGEVFAVLEEDQNVPSCSFLVIIFG